MFLLPACAAPVSRDVMLVNEVLEDPMPEASVKVLTTLREPVVGLTTCGEELIATSGRQLWRIDKRGTVKWVMKVHGKNVTDVYCDGDEYLILEDLEGRDPQNRQLMRSKRDSDVFRTQHRALVSGDDLVLVTLDEIYSSFYSYGHWYVLRNLGKNRPGRRNETLAAGRFPSSCGQGCVDFIAKVGEQFEIRRYENSLEHSLMVLDGEVPRTFFRFGEGWVVGYLHYLKFPGTHMTDVHVEPYDRLLRWEESLVVVRGARLEMITFLKP